MKLLTLSTVALLGVFGLAACGSDDAAKPAAQTGVSNPTAGATFNDADVTFAQGMIPHHEQAIEMADMALDPTTGSSDGVRDIATRIKAGQDPEVSMMTAWLESWGQPVQMDMSEGHDMSSMDGMMTTEEMDALDALTGPEFDTIWMQMMIRHHEGAIAMAQTVKAAGSSPDALALADLVILAQQAEIAEMNTLLAG
ncbi:MAG TPA: DUF305 domain-containing protein [Ilumatobacteraceae bacterium]|nr:DUF305 domain-containing protein [Ilumatobacteraceae bacterium]HRB04653.1 DUF305 domain-containing protein [Ilumatobacteraceae bacterium]